MNIKTGDYKIDARLNIFNISIEKEIKLHDELKTEIEKMKPDLKPGDISDEDLDKAMNYTTHSLSILTSPFYSLLLNLYSYIEYQLKEICSQIDKKYKFRIRVKDLNAESDINKYIKYLGLVFEADLSKIESSLTTINQQKKTRNKIAHNWGQIRIAKEDAQKNKYPIQLIEGLELKIDYLNLESIFTGDSVEIVIEIKPIYIKNLIKTTAVFFKELLTAIKERENKLKNAY